MGKCRQIQTQLIEDIDALEHFETSYQVAADTVSSCIGIITGWVRHVCDDPTTRFTMSDGEAIIFELDKLVHYKEQAAILGRIIQPLRELNANDEQGAYE